MATREQEFSEVRRLLGFPKHQKPSSDLIVSALIRQEQFMMNRLNGSARGWSPNTVQLTVAADTAEYPLYSNDPTNTLLLTGFGKALFAYRELDNNQIVEVPFTDYTNELSNQSRDFVYTPLDANDALAMKGEHIAFFRSGANPKVRVYPVPDEARIYKIVYATGAIDWTTFDWDDVPFLPEWSHYRCLLAAATLIRLCEWSQLSHAQNKEYRAELREDITAESGIQEDEFRPYINNPQHEPTIGMIGAFWEEN